MTNSIDDRRLTQKKKKTEKKERKVNEFLPNNKKTVRSTGCAHKNCSSLNEIVKLSVCFSFNS